MTTRTLRPGRTYCAAVESYDCEAPAGFRNGSGWASSPGVHRDELHVCAFCKERVCGPCSTEFPGEGKVCNTHEDGELLDWIRQVERRKP